MTESFRIVVRRGDSSIAFNNSFNIAHLNTVTLSTKDVTIYFDGSMNTGLVQQGTAAIAATSVNITCTAMQVLPQGALPQGIALHMTRFSPIPGTQE